MSRVFNAIITPEHIQNVGDGYIFEFKEECIPYKAGRKRKYSYEDERMLVEEVNNTSFYATPRNVRVGRERPFRVG